MNEKFNSYDFQNTVRDVSEMFTQIVKSRPSLLGILRIARPATSTKYEWLEDVMSPKSFVIGVDYIAGSGVMTFASTNGLEIGSILTFEKVTGASSDLTVKVVGITGNDVNIELYGDIAIDEDENLGTGTSVKLISVPKNDGTLPVANNGREPTIEFNYTQIFDKTASVSKTAQSIKQYGIASAIDYQVATQLTDIQYDMVNSVIHGQRVQRGPTQAGSFGGILYFLKKAIGNKIDALGGAISSTLLNNGLSKATENGALNIDVVIGHPEQLRKISGFNMSNLNISQEDQARGTYVTEYRGDLGTVSKIVFDRNFPKDKVALVDSSKLALVPLVDREFSDMDATPNGADFYARRILGEYTLEVKNADTHVLIENLAI